MAQREDEPRDGWLQRALRMPVVVLVALYFLVDDVVLAAIRPLVARLAALRVFERIAAFVHGLSPYPTLLLFAVPFAVLEPPKLAALWFMATGHWRGGLALLVVSHLLSIVLVERLFHVTRDKLLLIPWFARLHRLVVALRDWAFGIVERTAAWRAAVAFAALARAGLARLRAAVGPVAARVAAAALAAARRLVAWMRRLAAG